MCWQWQESGTKLENGNLQTKYVWETNIGEYPAMEKLTVYIHSRNLTRFDKEPTLINIFVIKKENREKSHSRRKDLFSILWSSRKDLPSLPLCSCTLVIQGSSWDSSGGCHLLLRSRLLFPFLRSVNSSLSTSWKSTV